MQESERETDGAAGNSAGSTSKKPEANDLQKLMKERFGDAKFGTLMNSIVDEMFKNMAEVSPTFGATGGIERSGGSKPSKADKAIGADDVDEAGKDR